MRLVGIEPVRVSPHLSPRRGHPMNAIHPWLDYVLLRFGRRAASPTFGRFSPPRAAGLRAAYRPCSPKNLPQRSRAHGFTDGRVWTDKGQEMSFRMGTGSTGSWCAEVAHWTGSRHCGGAGDSGAFRAPPGVLPSSLNPPAGDPPVRETSRDSGAWSGRAGSGLPARARKPVPARSGPLFAGLDGLKGRIPASNRHGLLPCPVAAFAGRFLRETAVTKKLVFL